MSFLKKLFGKKEEPEATYSGSDEATGANDIARFQQEVLAVIPRYFSTPEQNAKPGAFTLRDKATGEILPYGEVCPEHFEQWKGIQSVPDRRGVIYDMLDNLIGYRLEPWQMIERLVDDRQVHNAFQYFMEHEKEIQTDDPRLLSAMAKANLVYAQYEKAAQLASQAVEKDPKLKSARIVLADIYHISGHHDPSHAIYDAILKEYIPADEKTEIAFESLYSFDGGILPSPFYAVGLLQSHPEVTADHWEAASNEFYYSPHFRAQHAYYLINQHEHMKGFVKLLVLTQEMPWYNQAVLNCYSLIDQLGIAEQLQEEKARLKALIDENNWSSK